MKMHEILQQDQDIWDLFTRKEEYSNPLRDKYGRFLQKVAEFEGD